MKILIVSRDYYPSVGGIQSHVQNLSDALTNMENEVRIFTMGLKGWDQKQPDWDALKGVHRVWVSDIRRVRGVEYVIKALREINRVVRANHFDVVHWHDCYFDSLITKSIRMEGVAKVFTNHSGAFIMARKSKVKLGYLNWSIRHANAVVAPSVELRDLSQNSGRRDVFYISNGVDVDRFSPSALNIDIRGRFGVKPSDFVVLCARRLEPKNGVETLVRSAALLTPEERLSTRYLIVGGGYPAERHKLEEFVQKNSLSNNVIFAGPVDNHEMPKYIAACDISVLPSLMEATSISGLEAMACGKPIVGSMVGGIPEIVADGVNGLLVKPGDPNHLVEAIRKLRGSPDLTKRMGDAARRRAEVEFSWPSIAARTVEVYRYAIETVAKNRRNQ